ncbi:MAG TPA: WHG domain-containing protein [Thermomicrobiales bacterium]|nr:WHG domain-containing protein [Thermomicrobiales bacterium]
MSRRAGLNRAAVVEAAAELIDAQGGELSLREVAQTLGVRTPSLYNHVEGLEDLRRELALLGLRELTQVILRAAAGRSGSDALLNVARAYRDYARARPGIYTTVQRVPAQHDAELDTRASEIVAVLAAIFEPLGFRDDDAVHAIRGFRSLLHGFVALEAAGGFGIPLDLDESFERAVRAYINGLAA